MNQVEQSEARAREVLAYHQEETGEWQSAADIREGTMEFDTDRPDSEVWANTAIEAMLAYASEVAYQPSGDWPADAEFAFGQAVMTHRKPFWKGIVCGWYRNSDGRLGFAVEANAIPGAIHVYPATALTASPTVPSVAVEPGSAG